jgi:ABC-type multidrug transport system fused ATPase/permease subunit
MKPLRHKICFKNVTFWYPDAEKPVLREISLTIPMGETLAIVGKTGSGKTTLARLLVRFYDPNHGIITIDETDLRQFSFDSLYQQISYVTQEVPILTGTIGENIRYGLAECGDDHVLKACVSACANFVFQWKQGLKTKVGEQGEKLSGGERQRLALARIFLRNPSVLILDEATAALDQITESDIQATFDQLLKRKDMTMIVIAHRINTVKGADRILVMDRGRIVDIGKHEELMVRCDLYQKLCAKMK